MLFVENNITYLLKNFPKCSSIKVLIFYKIYFINKKDYSLRFKLILKINIL